MFLYGKSIKSRNNTGAATSKSCFKHHLSRNENFTSSLFKQPCSGTASMPFSDPNQPY